ncbi:MAG TPA: hypothetical protein VFA44_11650 [Gaiellaceae bacterium]|nr:hypothetical protein [Gaiellaceae bacterium]
MTVELAPIAASAESGIVGDRQLVCVQTIAIGRLPAAPVPVTPGCFVAVTGHGPRGDSNGSGKTTFLGAVSLLLGDVGWRPATGAPEAANLLFDGTKAGVDVERYARAERGYVIGVFAREGGTDPLTVWLRINATAQYLWTRYADGICLVEADTPSAREAAADALWSELPDQRWGSKTYAKNLYGSAPRCVAWLQARGNATPGKSLLKLAQERMEPEQIGLALLELVGRDDLLHADAEARADLDERTRELERLRLEDERRRGDEDDELGAIAARGRAREQLALAMRLWRLHNAKGLVDATARATATRAEEIPPLRRARHAARHRARAARAELARLGDGSSLREAAERTSLLEANAREAHETALRAAVGLRTTLDQLEQTADALRSLAERWDGTPAADAERAVAVANEHERAMIARLGAADAATREAEHAVKAVETHGGGRAGETAARLAAAGVQARPLLDELNLDPEARDEWEPRLTLYEDAVAVDGRSRQEALAVAEAGDVLVFGSDQDREPPPGIATAPPAAIAFLRQLAEAIAGRDPAHAQLGAHVVVVGGFADPVIGRAARLDGAQRKLARSLERQQEADRLMTAAARSRELAEANREAARARRDLDVTTTQIETVRSQLHRAAAEENRNATAHAEAHERSNLAQRHWGGFEARRAQLEGELTRAEDEVSRCNSELRAAIDRLRRRTGAVGYWARAWGADAASAEAALADDPSGEARADADAYRRAANHALDKALTACGIDSDTGDGAPPGSGVAIAVSERTNASPEATSAGDDEIASIRYEWLARAFHALTDALGSWLERLQLEDEAAEAHIVADRSRREEALATAATACDERSRNLPIIQDGIERSVRTLLADISDRLNELDLAARGSGADLRIESIRPASAKEPWQWRVTPRYRRGPGGPLVPYLERANTATEKLLAIHLVLAALFAATNGRDGAAGRTLVLDELGDSLGDYHRDAVLRALAETAASVDLTVLGTCQDGVLEDAARHAGLVLYFQFRDLSDIVNAPTRVFGTAGDGLVELTGSYIERFP